MRRDISKYAFGAEEACVHILVIGALLLAMGCTHTTPVGPLPLDQQFTLAPGESASIGAASMHVTFLRVSSDSRCPADAFCIQAGDAVVNIRVTDGTADEHELHARDRARASATHGSFRVTLEQLQPHPFSGRTIAPGDYRATLTVARQ
jgi:hypothetical protein